MLRRLGIARCSPLAALCILAAAAPPPAAISRDWNGTWVIDRSQPEPEGGADDYRFTVTTDGAMRWEIPSLREVNIGRLDGTPMAIVRGGKPTGETISVRPVAPCVWRYTVAEAGHERGAGEMTLAADGRSWTDIPLDHGTPVNSIRLVYLKR